MTDSHRVYTNHFYAEDFETKLTDQRVNRKAGRNSTELKQLRLNQVPS